MTVFSPEHDQAQLIQQAGIGCSGNNSGLELPPGMDNWTVLDSVTSDCGFSGTAFQNATTGDSVVALQSQLQNQVQGQIQDQLLNEQTQQLIQQAEQAQQFYQQVSQTLSKPPSLTGHGLGGSLAQAVGAQTGAPTTTFNALGGSHLVPGDQKLDAVNTLNITNHHTATIASDCFGDPIGKTVHADPSELGPAPDWFPPIAEVEGGCGTPTTFPPKPAPPQAGGDVPAPSGGGGGGGGGIPFGNDGEPGYWKGILISTLSFLVTVQEFNTKLGIEFLKPKSPQPAARHFDPVLGIDIHLILVPPGVPVPLPVPFLGMLIDLFDYLPYIGSTVQVNGVERAQASTAGRPIPFHFPIGGPFAIPPGNECEMFMGSSTVTVDCEPFSYLALPALSCQIVGMPTPFRKKPKKTFSLTLPLTVTLPIPHGNPVQVGGAPTISLLALAFKGLFKLFGFAFKFMRMLQKASPRWQALSNRLNKMVANRIAKQNLPAAQAAAKMNHAKRIICKVTGHPVDVATGKVFTEAVDFELPGPLPLVWERVWYSSSIHDGELGHGWHHGYDLSLIIDDDVAVLRTADGRYTPFIPPTVEEPTYNPQEQLWLHVNDDGRYWLEDLDGLRHTFTTAITADPNQPDDITEHLLEAVVDANYNRIRFLRQNPQHPKALSGIIDSAGRQLQVDTGANGKIRRIRLITQTDHDGRTQAQTLVSYQYNDAGDLTGINDAYDATFRLVYRNHLLVKETDRNGLSFYFEYDKAQYGDTPNAAKCIKTWGDDLGNGELYYRDIDYDTDNQITRVTEGNPAHLAEGETPNIRTYHWNDQGLVTQEVDPMGHAAFTEWDNVHNKLSETDANGHTSSYAYDDSGRLVSTTDANGATTTITYDDQNNPVELTDADGACWQFEYDDRHNLTRTTDPKGAVTAYRRLPNGLPQVITDALGQQRSYVWNDAGELLAETNANGQHTRYEHDAAGNITAIHDGKASHETNNKHKQHTRYTYDANQRLTAITDAQGQTTQLQYNAAGKLTQHTDPSGRQTRYEYGALPLIKTRITPDGQRFSYDYDDELNLIGLTNENGDQYRLAYDANDQLVQETGFDGRVQQYHYNGAGQLVSHRDGDVRQTRFTRDALGQLLNKHSSDGEHFDFEYDTLGRLTAAINAHRQVQYAYDALGNVIEETQTDLNAAEDKPIPADPVTLAHAYDALGRRTQTTLPDGRTLNTDYDAEGHYTQITLGLGADQRLISRLQRDASGRVLNSTLGAEEKLQASFDYDPQGRLKQQRIQRHTLEQRNQTTMETVVQRDYGYDHLGRLNRIQDARKGLSEYHYDQRDRLISVQGARPEQLVYDPAGNILSSEQDANTNGTKSASSPPQVTKGNRLKVFQDRKFEYDDVGNLRKETRGNPVRETTTYRYSHSNQLTEVIKNGARTNYEYDALGRRTKKLTPDKTVTYYWNGDVLLSEHTEPFHEGKDTNGRPILYDVNNPPPDGFKTQPDAITYLYEPYSFRPLAQLKRHNETESTYYYHLDHLGTPMELTDEVGNLVWSVTYKAYGNVLKKHRSLIDNHLRFQGQYFDEETGLHYNRFRYYHPESGRYIHQDPIGLSGGGNLYDYPTNPISYIDPLGLSKKCEFIYRHVSKAEADQILAAIKRQEKPRLFRKPNENGRGLSRGAKWISTILSRVPKVLGRAGKSRPTHTLIIKVEKGTKEWLNSSKRTIDAMEGSEKELADKVLTKTNEIGDYGIGDDLLDEFNSKIIDIEVKEI